MKNLIKKLLLILLIVKQITGFKYMFCQEKFHYDCSLVIHVVAGNFCTMKKSFIVAVSERHSNTS